MATNKYRLTKKDQVVNHHQNGSRNVRLVRDYNDQDFSQLDIDALVASGDSFVTIATSLDDCTKLLTATESSALPQIEKAISVLLYLQRHYQVVRKQPGSHQ